MYWKYPSQTNNLALFISKLFLIDWNYISFFLFLIPIFVKQRYTKQYNDHRKLNCSPISDKSCPWTTGTSTFWDSWVETANEFICLSCLWDKALGRLANLYWWFLNWFFHQYPDFNDLGLDLLRLFWANQFFLELHPILKEPATRILSSTWFTFLQKTCVPLASSGFLIVCFSQSSSSTWMFSSIFKYYLNHCNC